MAETAPTSAIAETAVTWPVTFRIVAASYALNQLAEYAKADPTATKVSRILLFTSIAVACLYGRVYAYIKHGVEEKRGKTRKTCKEVAWGFAFVAAAAFGVIFLYSGWTVPPPVAVAAFTCAAAPAPVAASSTYSACIRYIPALIFFTYATMEYMMYNYPINIIDFCDTVVLFFKNPFEFILWKATKNVTSEEKEREAYTKRKKAERKAIREMIRTREHIIV